MDCENLGWIIDEARRLNALAADIRRPKTARNEAITAIRKLERDTGLELRSA